VAATLFDEVISRVSVPSTILTDQGGEFMAEVVECLLCRLGISHLWTSDYHLQTDAKCERVHFSVHNIITKLIDDKHDRWPDLLGTVALAYNATVHTSTGYSPHELFYSFAPSCPLDAMVSTPASDPVSNTDEFALQAFERLRETASFVRDFTGRQMSRMKQYYDSSVKPMSFADGEKVLVYNPKKKRGHFAIWAMSWHGPVVLQRKLNNTNYVVCKGKGKCVVIHVDHMCKLPISSLDGESLVKSTDPHTHTSEDNETSVPCMRRRTQPATDESSIHTADTASCSDRGDSISSVDKTADNQPNVINLAINAAAEAMSGSPDTCQTLELASQSTEDTDKTHVAPTGHAGGPQLITAGHPKHNHRMLQRYVNTISSSLIGRLESRLGAFNRPLQLWKRTVKTCCLRCVVTGVAKVKLISC